MPVTPTYPGVYIEEIPSGVRTITGVPTSITAFVGRTPRGPVDEPKTVNGYADFERIFGSLWEHSRLAYAVRDFYLNGGSQAIIVRLFKPFFADGAEQTKAEEAAKAVADAVSGDDVAAAVTAARKKADEYKNDPEKSDPEKFVANTAATAAEQAAQEQDATVDSVKQAAQAAASAATRIYTPLDIGGLTLRAAYPGSWGEKLRATIDVEVSEDVAQALGVNKNELFNLTVRDTTPGGRVEQFYNLTVKDTARRIDRVLENKSDLLRYRGQVPQDLPQTIEDLYGKTKEEERKIDDDLTAAEKAVASAEDAFAQFLIDKPGATDAQKKAKRKELEIDSHKSTLASAQAKQKTTDGQPIDQDSFIGSGKASAKKGLHALEKADLFNLLCIPPYKNLQ